MRNGLWILLFILFQVSICWGASGMPTDYISREEALILADAPYEKDYGVSRLPPDWTLYKTQEDSLSGLRYAVYIRTSDGQRVLSFAGTRNWTDWRNNFISSSSVFAFEVLSKSFGSLHLQYDRALEATLDAKHENKFNGKGRPLIVVGDSKGGGHVEYVGAMTKTLGIARNPAPIGNELLARIPKSNRDWANKGGILRMELASDPVSKLDVLPGSRHLGVQESYRVPVVYREAYKHRVFNIAPELFPDYLITSHTERDLLLIAVQTDKASRLPKSQSLPIRNYFTTEGPGIPAGKTRTEAGIITGLVPDSKKVVVFGETPTADITFNIMKNKIGSENVMRVHRVPDFNEQQRIAREFGADAILGVKSTRESLSVEIKQKKVELPIDRREVLPPSRPDPLVFRRNDPPPPVLGGGPPPCQRGECGGGGGWRPPSPSKPSEIGGMAQTAPPTVPMTAFSEMRSVRSPSYGVGGVMLQGAANVSNGGSELGAGNFSLIFENGDAGMDVGQLRKFMTALWAVYFSKEGPGISIDPIAPEIDKHLVRYIGQVVNSDLGRVMREADYLMKKWAVGTDRPDLPGFRNPDDIAGRRGVMGPEAWSRFWFVPENMRFRKSGNMLLFEDGRITLKTEYLNGRREANADPANEEWAAEFTASYATVAERYPVYQELFEYAKMVSLAKYLKENGVPMLWYLLANKDMILTEDSPGTVDALAKKSEYFEYVTISGGVDLAATPQPANYVIDAEAAKALQEAFKRHGGKSEEQPSLVSTSNIVFEAANENYTLTPSNNLTLSSSVATGETFQTDLALKQGGMPGMELVRYYNPDHDGVITFGKGWHLMIPYKVFPEGDKKITFRNAIIPEKMVVKNLLSGRQETLVFSDTRYSIAGYVPSEKEESGLVGLFLLSNGSFRLADKIGSEFQFDQAGDLTDMILTNHYRVHFEYGTEQITRQAFRAAPYRIEPEGDERVEVLNVTLPKRLRLVDEKGHTHEVFSFASGDKHDLVGYTPENETTSQYSFLSLLTDGSFLLKNKNGNQTRFNAGGGFEKMTVGVVKAISQGKHKVEFDYQYNGREFGISTARMVTDGVTAPLYQVMYYYGDDGRLEKVRRPAGEEVMIKYKKGRIELASR